MSNHYPTPDRSDLQPGSEPSIEPGKAVSEGGWATGMFSDGRPWRAEQWSESLGDQWVFAVTFFFSTLDLDKASESELADLLEREGLVKFEQERQSLGVKQIQDASGNTMWSVTVTLFLMAMDDDDEDERPATTSLNFEKYPKEQQQPFRLDKSPKPNLPG